MVAMKDHSEIGIAGIDSPGIYNKTVRAMESDVSEYGMAGNLGSTLRPAVEHVLQNKTPDWNGDVADEKNPRWRPKEKRNVAELASRCFERAVFFEDPTYLCYPTKRGFVWKAGMEELFSAEKRVRPVDLDSGAWRIYQGTAPEWARIGGLDMFLGMVDFIKPRRFMSLDVVGNAKLTLENYKRILARGYTNCVPVFQYQETWDSRLTGRSWKSMRRDERAACVIENARRAALSPSFRFMAEHSKRIAIGGLNDGPLPVGYRALYASEILRQTEGYGIKLWLLGQANVTVLNELATLGILDDVSTDGSHWIHAGSKERVSALTESGRLHTVDFARMKLRPFLKPVEMMASNLRAWVGLYAHQWKWPEPLPTDEDWRDPEVQEEVQVQARQVQLDLWSFLNQPKVKTA